MAKKLLWVSPFSLHDTSSGAAVQCKAMLEALAKRGVEIKVLGSFIFDSPRGATHFPKLEEEIKERNNQPVLIKEDTIEYHYTICKSRSMSDFTYDESWRFFQYFCALCNTFRPDIAMGYGTGTSGIAVHTEAKRRGIPFVYPLCNGNHPYYSFDDCALLMTESNATAQLYATRDRLNVQAHGIFIDKEKFVSKDREPKYITMVNPCPTKGVSIFAKIAQMAQKDKDLKKLQFLAVDGRGSFAESLCALHLPDSDKKPYEPKMFKNVDIATHTGNMKEIYKLTRILIAPSLAYESWGRVVSEAVLNGIPCLVSSNNGGGLQEAMAGAGYALDLPQECIKDNLRLPSDEEIKPWIDALKKALKQDFSKELKIAQKELDIETSTNRALEILEPLFARKASQNPQLILNGILRMESDGNFR